MVSQATNYNTICGGIFDVNHRACRNKTGNKTTLEIQIVTETSWIKTRHDGNLRSGLRCGKILLEHIIMG